jgi:hypothetical protein
MIVADFACAPDVARRRQQTASKSAKGAQSIASTPLDLKMFRIRVE